MLSSPKVKLVMIGGEQRMADYSGMLPTCQVSETPMLSLYQGLWLTQVSEWKKKGRNGKSVAL